MNSKLKKFMIIFIVFALESLLLDLSRLKQFTAKGINEERYG
jgi:hypothetical protein